MEHTHTINLRLVMVGVVLQQVSARKNVLPMPKQPTVPPAQRVLVMLTPSTQHPDGAIFPQTARLLKLRQQALHTAFGQVLHVDAVPQ